MQRTRTSARTILVAAATTALVLAGCSGSDDEPEATAAPTSEGAASETMAPSDGLSETAEPTGAAPEDVAIGRGVTEEPCEEGAADRGCIYLGIISDLSVGPFAPLGVPITDAQRSFWADVNANGGIGGAYDVDLGFTEDAEYNPQIHAESYENIRGEVLALAQSLGTSQTLSVIAAMGDDSMSAVPMTWWSGWNFDPKILQSGSSYCTMAMNGVDYVASDEPSISILKFPGDYGEDWAAGVRIAAEANGLEVLTNDAGEDTLQVPISAGGDTAAAVGTLASQAPDYIFAAIGPTELGEIAGGLAQQGWQGRIMGANPSWNGALLDSAVGPVLSTNYHVIAPFENYGGTSEAHDALRAAIPEPANDGATYGWMQSYPLLSVLEQAYTNGDLTPEGIMAAATTTLVDYHGALPDLDLSASPADQEVRHSAIAVPDANGDLGLTTVESAFSGDTAANHPYDEPCFNLE